MESWGPTCGACAAYITKPPRRIPHSTAQRAPRGRTFPHGFEPLSLKGSRFAPFTSALAQITPNPPQIPIIRSLPAPQSSLGPTAVSSPPGSEVVRVSQPELPRPPVAPKPRRSRRGPLLAALAVLAVSAGVGIAAHERPMKPEVVSGRAKPKLTATGASERWWQGDVNIVVDESLTKVWPDAQLGVSQAIDGWVKSGAKLPRPTVDMRKSAPLLLEPDGENRIYYGPITINGHENDLGITLQYTNPETGEILESDVVINSKHPFVVVATEEDGNDDSQGEQGSTGKSHNVRVKDCSAKFDVTSVVTHEIGHFWGLGEDLVDGNATMFYSTSACSVIKRVLKTDDVSAITALYSAPAPAQEPSAAGVAGHCSVGAPGRGVASSGAAAATVAFALSALLRRRRRAV
jgi:hypothetical protein